MRHKLSHYRNHPATWEVRKLASMNCGIWFSAFKIHDCNDILVPSSNPKSLIWPNPSRQKSWFAPVCGFLRPFCGFLRPFCGFVLPPFFFKHKKYRMMFGWFQFMCLEPRKVWPSQITIQLCMILRWNPMTNDGIPLKPALGQAWPWAVANCQGCRGYHHANMNSIRKAEHLPKHLRWEGC